MGIGVSLVLIAMGAVPVEAATSGFNIQIVGYILLAVGAIGALLFLSLVSWWGWSGVSGHRAVVGERLSASRRTVVEDKVVQ